MKKFFIILIFCFLIQSLAALADELGSSGEMGDLMQYSNTFDSPFSGQKQVTDETFQKTLNQVKAKQNSKKRQPRPFQVKNFHGSDTTGYINETGEKNLLLSIPVNLINGDGTDIPIGHYKILAKKEDNKLYLNFYQSSSLIAKVPAIETKSDFDEKELNFVKLLPYNEQRIKIIYGSMDLNAYTFVNIKQ